ncbi:MAG: thioredoxin-disulfide reductase [Bacilli bacterium]|nr:thioredoxin-disulfide reductase [Bacilli bacterium]
MYDIIIIGAGPAGLTAALYALRANKKIVIFEAKTFGGQIINASKIVNYPGIEQVSGFDFATTLYNQVKNLGAEIKYETVLRVEKDKTVITNKDKYKAKSVIIATGAENRKLNIDGENKFIGKGVSYCATCDGNFFKGLDVAVVGGGNTAIADALYLSDIVNKVYLIHRRDEFRGEPKKVEELKNKKNIELVLNSNVVKINGNDKVESIEVENNDKERTTIEVSGIFIAVGQDPKNAIFNNVVELNDKGYIISEDGVHTSTEGIYVAGDTREKVLRQLTTAVSDGSIAATIAIKEGKDK